MEGISKEELIRLQSSILARDDEECANLKLLMLTVIIDQCQELQEPWMALEEFLKNPKYEWCWIMLTNKQIHMAYISYNDSENYVFYLNDFDRDESYSLNEITHVMPIHKPELPR